MESLRKWRPKPQNVAAWAVAGGAFWAWETMRTRKEAPAASSFSGVEAKRWNDEVQHKKQQQQQKQAGAREDSS